MDKPNLSTCCNALVKVASSGEGTSWHECTKCGKPCDVVIEPGGNKDEENKK